MSCHQLDRYGLQTSPIHHLTAGLKLGLCMSALLITNLLPTAVLYFWTGIMAIAGLAVIRRARIPVRYIFSRLLLMVPLLLTIIVANSLLTNNPGTGLDRSARAILSIYFLLILMTTTHFYHIVDTLERCRFPRFFTLVLGFAYRYFFCLTDELNAMRRSFQLRQPEPGLLSAIRLFPLLMGQLFIRSYERAQRITNAMIMQGFEISPP